MHYFFDVIRNKYADFDGRAHRTEYWMYTLFNFIFACVFIILDSMFGTTVGELPYGVFYFLFWLATIIPSLAVTVRRLHDVGKSGWFLLMILIPLVGAIWILVLLCTDSDNGDNGYGPNPKGIGNSPAEEAGVPVS